jgi:hypothetical protein
MRPHGITALKRGESNITIHCCIDSHDAIVPTGPCTIPVTIPPSSICKTSTSGTMSRCEQRFDHMPRTQRFRAWWRYNWNRLIQEDYSKTKLEYLLLAGEIALQSDGTAPRLTEPTRAIRLPNHTACSIGNWIATNSYPPLIDLLHEANRKHHRIRRTGAATLMNRSWVVTGDNPYAESVEKQA